MNIHLRHMGFVRYGLMIAGFLEFGALILPAANYYVATNGVGGDYKSWGQAASNIQWAVNAAANGDTVWVSNGVYTLASQIVITNGITLQSTNGPDATIINGNFIPGSDTTNNRCLWMSNSAACVSGFTLSNGAVFDQNGAGVWAYKGTVKNCAVRNNRIYAQTKDGRGGGIYMVGLGTVDVCRVTDNGITNMTADRAGFGGGIHGGVIRNCVINSNRIDGGKYSTEDGGAGVGGGWQCKLLGSLVAYNYNEKGFGGGCCVDTVNSSTVTVNYALYAGGLFFRNGIVSNCLVTGNWGRSYGGGIYVGPNFYSSSIKPVVMDTVVAGNTNGGISLAGFSGGVDTYKRVDNCVMSNNTSFGCHIQGTNCFLVRSVMVNNPGRGVNLYYGTLRNCLIVGNSNTTAGGGVFIQPTCTKGLISACTIVGNQSPTNGAGLRIESVSAGAVAVSSCIIYNNGVNGTNDAADGSAGSLQAGALTYSCLGTNPGGSFTGAGMIVADPKFKDLVKGNYRLAGDSPCVNTGFKEDWMVNSVDLDGNPRIRYGAVDMGAYEGIFLGTIYSLR